MRHPSLLLGLAIGIAAITSIGLWYHAAPKPDATITLKALPFSQLPGWQSTHALKSLQTLQLSCQFLLKKSPSQPVGNRWLALQAKDWLPLCQAASTVPNHTEAAAKLFFETWFQPMEFTRHSSSNLNSAYQCSLKGLFTGYYLPEFPGSVTQSTEYPVPIYGVPDNLLQINLNDFDPQLPSRSLMGRVHNRRILPYYSRKEIDQGAIADNAPILAYVHNPIDRVIIEIQGSAILNLTNGKQMTLGYASKNGLPYTPIGRVLLERHLLPAEQISLQSIRAYLTRHPEQQAEVIHQNRSFVFFQIMSKKGAVGTQGTQLTPGYSLAVDPEWVPLGMPVWLSTTYPDPHTNTQQPLQRLMIAQDTGGAIKGTVRGDVYWGSGEDATSIAGKMKSPGRYWLLVPKSNHYTKLA